MSTLILGDDSAVFGSLQEAYSRLARHGHLVLVATSPTPAPLIEAGCRHARLAPGSGRAEPRRLTGWRACPRHVGQGLPVETGLEAHRISS
jgi:hypothetical protein